MSDHLADITDEELQERLARFGCSITTKGKMTDAQRQIQKKKLNHLEAKERAEREKAEKEAAKREKEEKELAKRALESSSSSQPQKKRANTNRRRTVAIPSADHDVYMQGGEVIDAGPSKIMSPLTTREPIAGNANTPESSPLVFHLLDAGIGRSAAAVPVTLSVLHATKGWFQLAERRTNTDGACPGLITSDLFQGGMYKIRIDTDEYYRRVNGKVHFPEVEIAIHVEDPGERYTVNVLLMPYGYTSTVVKNI